MAATAGDKLALPDHSMAALLDLTDRTVNNAERVIDPRALPAPTTTTASMELATWAAPPEEQSEKGSEPFINVLQIWMSCTDAGIDAKNSRTGNTITFSLQVFSASVT